MAGRKERLRCLDCLKKESTTRDLDDKKKKRLENKVSLFDVLRKPPYIPTLHNNNVCFISGMCLHQEGQLKEGVD